MTTPEHDQPRVIDVGLVGLDEDVVENPSMLSNPDRLSNPLDALREAVKQQVVSEDVTYPVPTRPGMSVRYSTTVDMEHVQLWRRSSNDKTAPDNFSVLKFSMLIIANTAKAFAFEGQEPTGGDGEPITFVSPEVGEWTGHKRALDRVRAIFANDGHVIATAGEIMQAAGYGDEIMEANPDPTMRS